MPTGVLIVPDPGQLKTYMDAGATDLALLPVQTGPADLRRVWEVAAALLDRDQECMA